MAKHIILHAGFHKTGTTSLQHWLATHRRKLARDTDVLVPVDLRNMASVWAGRYCQSGMVEDLEEFKTGFTDVVSKIEKDRPNLIISDENLLGKMPGRVAHWDIARAKQLLETCIEVLHLQFGADCKVTCYFTLRARQNWMNSLYRHVITRAPDIRALDEFSKDHAHLPGLDVLARTLAGDTPYKTSWMVDTKALRLGAAVPILDLLDIPNWRRRRFDPPQLRNVGASMEVVAQFRRLNASVLDRDALKAQKQAILKQADGP